MNGREGSIPRATAIDQASPRGARPRDTPRYDSPCYVLVRSDDLRPGPELGRYVRTVDETLTVHGAEILVQNLPARVMEGSWDGFVTLLRFPDRETAEAWYDSPEYTELKTLRQQSSTPTAILVEGVAEGHTSRDLATIFNLP